jgi:hypothetical protein
MNVVLLDEQERSEQAAVESGENLWEDTGSRRRQNLSPQERQRQSQWMRDYWAKKRADAAAATTDVPVVHPEH